VGGKPLGRVIDRVATEGGLLIVAGGVVGYMDPPVAVGDCVPVEPRASDYELTSTVCASARGTFGAAERSARPTR
jgi:hypothetical protein